MSLDLENWQTKKFLMEGSSRELRVICVDAPGVYPVIAVDTSGDLWTFDLSGHGLYHKLINVPPVTITRWVNVREDEDTPDGYACSYWNSKDHAQRCAGDALGKAIPVTITFTPNGR